MIEQRKPKNKLVSEVAFTLVFIGFLVFTGVKLLGLIEADRQVERSRFRACVKQAVGQAKLPERVARKLCR